MRAEEMAMAYTGFGCGHILTGHYRDALIALDLADVQLCFFDTHAPAVRFYDRICAHSRLRQSQNARGVRASHWLTLYFFVTHKCGR